MTWIVYEANGGDDGKGDRVFGPYRLKRNANRVADYMNTFPQTLGRAWVLPLQQPGQAPGFETGPRTSSGG